MHCLMRSSYGQTLEDGGFLDVDFFDGDLGLPDSPSSSEESITDFTFQEFIQLFGDGTKNFATHG